MHLTHLPQQLCLPQGELLAWKPPHCVMITVQSGWVWVTRENDAVDHVLHPGAVLLLPRGRLACISADNDSWLSVSVQPPRWQMAQWRWLPQQCGASMRR